MPEKYDVIIVGAGIGGLTAGAILAKNGKKVLLLEKNPVPGGYAVNFRRKGFEFDASLHMMQGCNKGGISYNILKKCGIVHRLKFIRPEFLYHSFYPGLEIKVKQKNPRAFIENLKEYFPEEGKGIDALIADVKKTLKSFEEFQKYGRMSTRIKYYTDRTCKEIFNLYIQNPKLVAIFSQLWPYFGLPPTTLSGYYLPFLIYDYHFNGGYYPEGGSAKISNSLKEVIFERREKILLDTEVVNIMVKNKRALGVITKNGKEFLAEHIISNIDARATFLTLVGNNFLPKYFIKELMNMEQSISAFQVYLGLDVCLNKLGFSDYITFINPDFDLDEQYKTSVNNEIEKAPFVITIYSNISRDPKYSSKSNVVLAFLSGYDYWSKFSPNAYKKNKSLFAEILINRAANFIPKLKSYIKIINIATPLTMERYTGNYKGAIYGFANNVFQCGERRALLKTPLKNLYLAGAWTYPGSGISGTLYSGERAAMHILQIKS